MAYENVISDENTQSETRAKATGLLKKFKNYNYITMTCLYLDILEKIVPASQVFEDERLLPFEVKASIQTTIANLTDYLDDDYDDIDSHIQRFFPKSNSERISGYILESHYNSPQDKSRKLENHKPVKIVFPSDMTLLKEDTVRAGKAIRRVAAEKIIEMLKERFQNLDEEIFSLMKWCNLESWTDDKDYGTDEVRAFASHFCVPLLSTAYDETKIRLEWKNLRRHVSLNLPGKEACVLWKNILSYKRKEFPNICLREELMYCLCGSNSAVERGFSILTMMLSDKG